MKLKTILGLILVISGVIGMITCGIQLITFQFQNPDMTRMRCVMENPKLVIYCIIWAILGYTGVKLM